MQIVESHKTSTIVKKHIKKQQQILILDYVKLVEDGNVKVF